MSESQSSDENREPASSPDEEVEIHLVFDYIIQRVPTRTKRAVFTRNDDINVFLRLSRKHLDERGYPDAAALWFAEGMFLKFYNKKHLPDVRLLGWKSHLKGDVFVLSEYRVMLPPSLP
ncbi:MAG: hypothetical protein AB7G08_23940 [Hyphomicrobiaceae bacterium]